MVRVAVALRVVVRGVERVTARVRDRAAVAIVALSNLTVIVSV